MHGPGTGAGWRGWTVGLTTLLVGLSPGLAAARAVHSYVAGPGCPGDEASSGQAASPRPDRQRAVFASKVERIFFWIRQFSRPTLPVCMFRTGVGLPIPLCCRDTLRLISKRLGVPLWVLERLNPGYAHSVFRHGHRVRLPAVRESIRKWCFLPVRDWRDDQMPDEVVPAAPHRHPVSRRRPVPRIVHVRKPAATSVSANPSA